jgi:predicted RNA methylase
MIDNLRNKELGQVWTPEDIADKMVDVSSKYINKKISTFLDPALGEGILLKKSIEKGLVDYSTNVLCYEIDNDILQKALVLKNKYDLKAEFINQDYLSSTVHDKVDFAIMNPPYIRQEKIDSSDKSKYLDTISRYLNFDIPAKSNLYIYFLFKALYELKSNGVLCAILYDSIDQSRYGKESLKELNKHAKIVESFNVKAPFKDAIVDASILVLVKREKRISTTKAFSDVRPTKNGFIQLSELAKISRGTTLHNSKVFIAETGEPFFDQARPIIKKQKYVDGLVVQETHPERAYLYSSRDNVDRELIEWLKSESHQLEKNNKTIKRRIKNEQSSWYEHKLYTPPIIFNYYIRDNPRYLLNIHQLPIADNFYGIEAYNISAKVAWLLLNSSFYIEAVLDNSRNQGNGLRKLQLYEFREANVFDWNNFTETDLKFFSKLADSSIKNGVVSDHTKALVNSRIANAINLSNKS